MAAEPGVLPEGDENGVTPPRRLKRGGLILSLIVTAIVVGLAALTGKALDGEQTLDGVGELTGGS